MLEMRGNCEHCDVPLDPERPGTYICSYECTYCADCALALDLICPSCGGEMMERPIRLHVLRS